jgi:hypothetical protein
MEAATERVRAEALAGRLALGCFVEGVFWPLRKEVFAKRTWRRRFRARRAGRGDIFVSDRGLTVISQPRTKSAGRGGARRSRLASPKSSER